MDGVVGKFVGLQEFRAFIADFLNFVPVGLDFEFDRFLHCRSGLPIVAGRLLFISVAVFAPNVPNTGNSPRTKIINNHINYLWVYLGDGGFVRPLS